MKRSLFAFTLLLAFSGCGGGSPPVIPGAKHGGNMIQLFGKTGYVEICFEVAGAASTGERGKVEPKSVVVWFYGGDGLSSLTPAPSDVRLKVGANPPMTLALRESDGAFVSAPGDFPDGLRGTLDAKLGGDSIEQPVAIR